VDPFGTLSAESRTLSLDSAGGYATMTPEGDDAVNFREYLRLLRRRWLLMALVTALSLSAAVASTFLVKPTYQSQAAVLVRAVTADPLTQSGRSGGGVNLDTERQLVLSTAVAERAAKTMQFAGPPTDLIEHVSVTVPADTQVLIVRYSAPEPRLAQRGAQAFADGYLSYREEKALRAVTSAGSNLQRRIRVLQEQLNTANATIADPGANAERKRQATVIRDFLVGELGVLRVQSATLSIVDVSPGEVIAPARVPERPASPNLTLNMLGGLFLGLILAVALAVVRDRSVETLGGREGLEQHLNRPVLGAIPNDTGWKQRAKARLVVIEDPSGPVAEAYRALATKLLLLAKRRDIKTVMVMSPSAGEGKSSITANLAVELVGAGRHVLVISADTRRPRLHRFFGVTNDVGLLNALADEASVEDVTQPVDLPRRWKEPGEVHSSLRVLPSGYAVTRSMRGLSSDQLGSLLKDLREEFDFVLIDSPAALLVADALAAATTVDGILMVADARTTKPESIKWLRQQLDQVDAHVLGGVLNRDESPNWKGHKRYHSDTH
jgi:capsular exopolysaccharide synthesis family protein